MSKFVSANGRPTGYSSVRFSRFAADVPIAADDPVTADDPMAADNSVATDDSMTADDPDEPSVKED